MLIDNVAPILRYVPDFLTVGPNAGSHERMEEGKVENGYWVGLKTQNT